MGRGKNVVVGGVGIRKEIRPKSSPKRGGRRAGAV